MKHLFLTLIVVFTIISCQIRLDGNSYYSVQGKIVDSLNQPIHNHLIKVVSSQHDLFIYNESIILNECKTDENGNFKMNFPSSTANVYLQFEPNFFKYDSISDDGYYYGFDYSVLLENEVNNIYNTGQIHLNYGY